MRLFNQASPWSDYSMPIDTPKDGCLDTVLDFYIKKCEDATKNNANCDWKNNFYKMPKIQYPTGICKTGIAYRHVDIFNSGFNFALASKVPMRELSNFDGSKWESATMEELKKAKYDNKPTDSTDPDNWYYVDANVF